MKNLTQYRPETDSSRAAWAAERISPFRERTLQTIVPSGFEQYVRLCQPAWRWPPVDPHDVQALADIRSGHYGLEHATPVRWRDAAAESGKPIHRLMQWHDIAPPPMTDNEGGISTPIEYEITPDMVSALFKLLMDYSGPDQECLCAFWDGYAGLPELHEAGAARFSGIGQQTYLLFHASLSTVAKLWSEALEDNRMSEGRAPNAIWPSNQAWYYSVPIGPMTSYLGGPAELVETVRGCAELETYEAFISDKIWGDPVIGP